MEDLITKFIEKGLSKAEALELKKWLDEDEEHVRFFKNYVNYWDLSNVEVDLSRYKVWKKLSTNAEASLEIIDTPENQRNYRSFFYKVAAILIIALGIGFSVDSLVSTSPGNDPFAESGRITKYTSRGQKLTLKLPDGTLVKLNAGSSVSYPVTFQENSRSVRLSGEAFFNVVRDEDRPFHIECDGIEVAVLGTSFNINNYEDADAVVSVLTGTVAVTDPSSGFKTLLERNQRVRVDKERQSMNKEVITSEDMDFDWTDNYLAFDNLGMQMALEVVSNWYDVDFRVEQGVNSNGHFRAKFKNPTLEDVMRSLAFAYGFEYKIENNKINIMK